jgi:glucosylceramidase
MKKLWIFMIIIASIFMMTSCIEEEELTPVEIKDYRIVSFVTKGDKSALLREQEAVESSEQNTKRNTVVSIDSSITYQTMDGFGAAMTESSAYLINQLTQEQRDVILNDLFGEDGIGIGFVRLPMGASDFALSNYSYNDIEEGTTDLNMEHFSLQRDFDHVIPILKMVKNIKEDVLFLGSPWSAPAWMKDTKTMNGGSIKNEYLDAYATYFVKFIQGYQQEGLDIYAVTPQNEPLHQTTNYPTMYMSSQQQLTFIIKLKQAFDQANLETLIISYDHNWDRPNYPMSILASPTGYEAVAGSGFHCYGGNVSAQQQVVDAYPDKGIWFTECSGGGWATNFASNMAWNMENVFIGSINYFAKGVLMWNLALDDQDGPTNGGCMNCRGVITIHEDGTYTRNEEYYMIGHFSKFVKRGATRIKLESNNTNIFATAFKNPDGEMVVVMHNKSRNSLAYTLEVDGALVNLTIPAESSVSYVINEK